MIHQLKDTSYLDMSTGARYYVNVITSPAAINVMCRIRADSPFIMMNGYASATDAQAALDQLIVSMGQSVVNVLPPQE